MTRNDERRARAMSESAVLMNVDGEEVTYRGRSVAEALGQVRLADLARLAARSSPNKLLMAGMLLDMGNQADGYAWVGVRAYELVALLNAAAMLDEQIEASREPEPSNE